MSRMFDAILRGSGEASQVMRSYVDESAPAAAMAPARSPQAAPAPTVAPVAGTTSGFTPAVRTLPLMVANRSPLLIFDQPQNRAAEQYRLLRTKILHHPKQPKVILVSSPEPRDGKTVTAVNLAAALSLKASNSVLLMDGDFRRSSIADQLGLPESPGSADVLENSLPLENALIQAQQYPNLCILPSGVAKGNPSELFETLRWQSICELLRRQFTNIVVDSPPIGVLADYHLLQTTCDAVIVVIRPDHTNRTQALRALELVPKDKLLGVVLNCVEDWFLSKPYHYHSAYYAKSPVK